VPIRAELLHFYRGPRWAMARARILARAGGHLDLLGNYLGGARCEECGRLDGDTYFNYLTAREVTIQIGIAHRNHTAGDDRDDNLAAWCRKCHLLYDADEHTFTRMEHKDAKRPLLREMSASV
jgi:hypothetical protein